MRFEVQDICRVHNIWVRSNTNLGTICNVCSVILSQIHVIKLRYPCLFSDIIVHISRYFLVRQSILFLLYLKTKNQQQRLFSIFFLTDANVCGNATNVTICNPCGFQNFVHSCFTQFLIVKKSRIWVNIWIVTFMDGFGLWMDLNHV